MGRAGKYTLLAELLPEEQRLAANTLVSSLGFAAMIAGPAIAGVLATYVSSALVLGIDALTTCSSPCSLCAPGCRSRGTSPQSTLSLLPFGLAVPVPVTRSAARFTDRS